MADPPGESGIERAGSSTPAGGSIEGPSPPSVLLAASAVLSLALEAAGQARWSLALLAVSLLACVELTISWVLGGLPRSGRPVLHPLAGFALGMGLELLAARLAPSLALGLAVFGFGALLELAFSALLVRRLASFRGGASAPVLVGPWLLWPASLLATGLAAAVLGKGIRPEPTAISQLALGFAGAGLVAGLALALRRGRGGVQISAAGWSVAGALALAAALVVEVTAGPGSGKQAGVSHAPALDLGLALWVLAAGFGLYAIVSIAISLRRWEPGPPRPRVAWEAAWSMGAYSLASSLLGSWSGSAGLLALGRAGAWLALLIWAVDLVRAALLRLVPSQSQAGEGAGRPGTEGGDG